MLAFHENLFFRLSVTREFKKGDPFGRVYFGTLTDSNFLSYSASVKSKVLIKCHLIVYVKPCFWWNVESSNVRNSLLFLNLSSNRYYLSAVFISTPRDRLEDMRFLYDTAAETNSKISFDSADPFYDSLPWFRLIGRYFGSSFWFKLFLQLRVFKKMLNKFFFSIGKNKRENKIIKINYFREKLPP